MLRKEFRLVGVRRFTGACYGQKDVGRGNPGCRTGGKSRRRGRERFWRGTNPTGATGSGIGLAVVAELVRGHDGDVTVQSTPGQGTTFVVSLPLA